MFLKLFSAFSESTRLLEVLIGLEEAMLGKPSPGWPVSSSIIGKKLPRAFFFLVVGLNQTLHLQLYLMLAISVEYI